MSFLTTLAILMDAFKESLIQETIISVLIGLVYSFIVIKNKGELKYIKLIVIVFISLICIKAFNSGLSLTILNPIFLLILLVIASIESLIVFGLSKLFNK